MTTALTASRAIAEATHQGIDTVTIHVQRNADMSINAEESLVAVRVAEYDHNGVLVNRREIERTLAQMNDGGAPLQQLKTKTREYYQFIEQLARSAGILGQGTDTEDFA